MGAGVRRDRKEGRVGQGVREPCRRRSHGCIQRPVIEACAVARAPGCVAASPQEVTEETQWELENGREGATEAGQPAA